MMNEDDYDLLKNSFISSQILFDKLNRVANQVEDLDYDESGMYQDEEEMYERHWLKLSSKIVDKMSDDLSEYKIELLKNELLSDRELKFNLSTGEESSKIVVNYSEDGALGIKQIS